jgi:hypothetical protein
MRADFASWSRAAWAVFLLALAIPRFAWAHHTPGHSGSEGVRNLNSLGNRGGKALSRILILNDFGWQPTAFTPGLRNETSVLGEYAPVSSFSFGAQAPLLIVDEIDRPTKVGYGDTRAFVRFTPNADKLVHRTLTFNLGASFPTRTVHVTIDPGRVWSATPSVIFTRTYGDWYWQAIGLGSVETRPAGIALDFSAGGQAGGRLADGKLALGGGVIMDVRAANFCASPDGPIAYCSTSRAGEHAREPGSIRATAIANGSVLVHPKVLLLFGVQVPFTVKRDVDLGLTLGLQVLFR